MTDDNQRYDELRRRLADEGRASAPHDLAPEVMRRVRAEPRRHERRFLRPALTLVAAAALVLAAVLGISRLGNGSASSGSASFGGGGVSQAPRTASSPEKDTANGTGLQPLVVHHVAVKNLGPIFDQASLPACPPGNRFSAYVPAPQLRQVADRLRSAAAGTAAGADTRDVELHRAPKGQARIRITCP
ncbi:MAG TPA: hypothetical protein VHL51_01855 [Gaiellales bacterium]|jgi:hypothetical protein|nr:hypothetical protein [Gaiellales bacterium]